MNPIVVKCMNGIILYSIYVLPECRLVVLFNGRILSGVVAPNVGQRSILLGMVCLLFGLFVTHCLSRSLTSVCHCEVVIITCWERLLFLSTVMVAMICC